VRSAEGSMAANSATEHRKLSTAWNCWITLGVARAPAARTRLERSVPDGSEADVSLAGFPLTGRNLLGLRLAGREE
jgi:hypothetical protein